MAATGNAAMRSQRLKKLLRWTVRILFVLLVILVVFILEENIRGRIMLARYKAELRAKGEKVMLAELDLPKTPMETKGAAALLEAADELVAFTNRDLAQLQLPLMRRIEPGRVLVLHRQEWPGYSQQSSRSWDRLSKDVAAVSNALDKARSVVRQPTPVVALDYTKDLRDQLSHLGKIYRLNFWLAAAAVSALHAGNLDAALENIVAITELTRVLKDERVVGVQRARLSMAGYGLKVTWEALQADGWTEPQLARLQKSWREAECLQDFVPSMEVDQVTSLQYYNRDTLKDLLDGYEFSYSLDDTRLDWADVSGFLFCHLGFKSFCRPELDWQVQKRLDRVALKARWLLWRAAWFEQAQLRTLRRWQETLNGARAVADRKAWTAYSAKRERRWTVYDYWRYLIYVETGESEMGRAARYETLREMAITAIALKRFQLRVGKFPADLSALVPEVLPDLPHDWMDGKPLRYRLNADGTYTLYSVGENGVDDGGDPDPSPVSWWLDVWGDGDEVWPASATAEEVEERTFRAPPRGRQSRGLKR